MFSLRQKREIAAAVQQILRATRDPELPDGDINFLLHVEGRTAWSTITTPWFTRPVFRRLVEQLAAVGIKFP